MRNPFVKANSMCFEQVNKVVAVARAAHAGSRC